MIRSGFRAALGLLMVPVAVVPLISTGAGADDGSGLPTTVGRVKVELSDDPEWANVRQFDNDLRRMLALDPETSSFRLLSLQPSGQQPDQYLAVLYDQLHDLPLEIVYDRSGKALSRRTLSEQPSVSEQEIAEAEAVLRESSIWSTGLKSGDYSTYHAMPGITVDGRGRRMINVGVLARRAGSGDLLEHEVVSVHLTSGEIVRYPTGAPSNSRATDATCGPAENPCGYATGLCRAYHVSWPADSPIWQFDLLHPSCTRSAQTDGTGIDIKNVYYKGKLVLTRMHIPVLNVKYQSDACGPYRDWLYEENCFQANGTDVSSGIRVTDGTPPATACESGSDTGNFRGVAIHDEGQSLWLVSEMQAGWYRYSTEYRFFQNGTMQPMMGFSAVSNSCVCNIHFHQSYWRLEWAIDGTANDPATGITLVERKQVGTQNTYNNIATEQKWLRPAVNSTDDWVRVRNAQTGSAWVIKPGPDDGNSSSPASTYFKSDFWALAQRDTEIDDPNTDTTINIDPWLNNEALGASKRSVTWYHAAFTHDINGGGSETCHSIGPTIELATCKGILTLDRSAYSCGGTVGLKLQDSDLIGSGQVNIELRSTSEPTPETITLTESPSFSGIFSGSIATNSAPPVAGDKKLSTKDGDTLYAKYVDGSACGTPNITIESSAPIDCRKPRPDFVRVTNITGSGATVNWSTQEPATTTLHWGLNAPGDQTSSQVSRVTEHAVTLSGLNACTKYFFWVEGQDQAANSGADTAGDRYYSFNTLTAGNAACAAHAKVSASSLSSDSCASGGAGNGDAIIDAGDQATFDVSVNNDGNAALTNVKVTVDSATPGVTMKGARLSYSNIAVGQTVSSGAPHFVAQIPASAACGLTVKYQLTVESDQGRWTDQFTQTVGKLTPVSGTALNESFSSGIPGTWTIIDGGLGGGSASTWTGNNPGNRSATSPLVHPLATCDARQAGSTALMDEQLLSPRMDLSNATSVTLSWDQNFNKSNSGARDRAQVDVRSALTGDSWSTVWWKDSSTPNPDHQTANVTLDLAGAPDAQVRFYYTGQFGGYWQVDNVKVDHDDVPACTQHVCSGGGSAGPVKPIPDGTNGQPVRVTKAVADGSTLDVTWDGSACASAGRHLIYGRLVNVSKYDIDGGRCWLPATGPFRWSFVPAYSLWFELAGNDGAGTESKWGTTQSNGSQAAGFASGLCWNNVKNDAATCP